MRQVEISRVAYCLWSWVGVPLFLLYVVCMFAAPFIQGNFDWKYVQSVWDRWQGLNVGVLALASSLIAFRAAQYHEGKRRERQFVAARAFLPHALSDLGRYFQSSADVLNEAWGRVKTSQSSQNAVPLTKKLLDLPENYREVFSRCIETATPDDGDYLAHFLGKLQIHNSRMETMVGGFSGTSSTIVLKTNVLHHMRDLAELHAMMARLFKLARDQEPLNKAPLTLEEYGNAYGVLSIRQDFIEGLHDLTESIVSNGPSRH